ncbi:hypothetical protein RintRC_1201 [Richelia intracellularis]|nr:hypothetical protein RintRC_1201 [Richelia intracellularis]
MFPMVKKNIIVLFVVRWERISACFDAFLSLATIHIWINKIILVGYIHGHNPHLAGANAKCCIFEV